MAKFCTNCGKELDENAALCLNCGVIVGNNTTNTNTANNNGVNKKKKGLPTWAIVLIVVGCVVLIPIIILVILGLLTYNALDNTIDDVVDDYNDYYNQETVTKTGTIGDTLSTENFKITLNEAVMYSSVEGKYYTDTPEEEKEYLVFFFDVENISDESQYISDFDFTGYADRYEIEIEYLYNDINGISDLNATLSPNKKAKGYVAFEVDTTWQEFEIHYSEWFDNEELVFRVVNEESSNITGA